MALILLRKHSHPAQNRREEEERRNSKRDRKTLPSSAPVERTAIQELAFLATAEDASSAKFHSLTRPMDANICQMYMLMAVMSFPPNVTNDFHSWVKVESSNAKLAFE